MKNYQTITTWLVTLLIVFGLACEPKPSEVTGIKTVEPAAPTEAEIKAAEAEEMEMAKAEAQAKAKAEAEAKARAEAEEMAKAKAEAEEKARAEAEARAKAEAETKAKAAAEAKAKVEAEEKARMEAEAEAKVKPKAEVEAKTPAEEPTEIDKTGIAVTINGVDIAESDVEARVEQQLAQMAKQMPPTLVEKYKPQLRRKVLEGMIVEKLLDEKVKAEEIVVTEEDIIAHLEEIGSKQQPPLSLEDIKAKIGSSGQSFDQVKQQIKKGMSYNELFEAHFGDKINVSEEDARKHYLENKKQFEIPEQVRASHILIKPDTSDSNVSREQAKAKAEELLKQIRDGADFAELAKANSACGSAARGGDLGFGRKATLDKRGSWVAPFEKAAFALKPGQISDIVETRFGYHIIKVTDHKDASVTTFEQAKDNILNMLKSKKQNELATQYVESLKAEADIVYPAGKEPKDSNVTTSPPE